MTTVAKDTGDSDFTPAPEGTHVARCVQVIDLGTQFSPFYQKSSHKILLGWELPGEMDGDRPHMVWNRYTLSLHANANLRAHLESWRGKKFTPEELAGFDLKNVLGTPCMLAITHTENAGKTYANVVAVMAITKGFTCPDQISETICFDLDEFNQEIFDSFSDNLKKTIENSAERKALRGEPEDQYSESTEREPPPQGTPDSEIPF
jgi:hypothetical protein